MHARRTRITLLGSLLLIALVQAAHAANGGAALAVGSSGSRYPRLVVPQPDSGAIVAYIESQTPTNEFRAQRVDRHGRPMWGNGVLLAGNALANSVTGLISDGAGGVLIAWSEDRGATGKDVVVQRLLTDGTFAYAASGLVVCNAARDQTSPQLLLGPSSSFYVVWDDDRPAAGSETDYYAQRVSLAGAPQWGANGLVVTPAGSRPYGIAPIPIADTQGGFIVNWRTSTSAQRAQRMTSAGTQVWGASAALINIVQDYGATLFADGSGGAWALGIDYVSANTFNLYLQHLSSAGANLLAGNGVSADASSGNWTDWYGVRDGSGGCWIFANQYDGAASRLRFNSAGAAVGTEVVLNYGGREFALTDFGSGFITSSVFLSNWQSARVYAFAQRWGYDGTAVYSGSGVRLGRDEPSLGINTVFSAPLGGGLMAAFMDGRYLTPIENLRYNAFGQAFSAAGGELWDDAELPAIAGAADAPNDQGGNVRVTWDAGVADVPAGIVRQYRVWRALSQAPAGAASARPSEEGEFSLGGRRYLYRAQLYWEMAASQPASGLASYALTTPTGQDSVAGSSADMSFMVEAVDDSSHHWWSAVRVAHSVDNLAPGALPFANGVYANLGTTLEWGASTAADLSGYEIFRGAAPSFVADDASRIAFSTDLFHVDPAGGPAYYRIGAVDVHGNRGPARLVVPSGVLDAGPPAGPVAWSLKAHWRAAEGALSLALDVPGARTGTLELFDVAGRRLWASPFRTDGASSITLRVPAAVNLAPGLVVARAVSGGAPVTTARAMVVR